MFFLEAVPIEQPSTAQHLVSETTLTPSPRLGAVATVRSMSRSGKWWESKLAPLLGAAYLALLMDPAPLVEAGPRLVALVVSASLLATNAYVVNDWSDRHEDRVIGKPSITGTLSRRRVEVLSGLLVLAGTAPWVFLGLPGLAWWAIAAIVVLPFIYSVPPLRWKTRGWLGLVADAGLAHVAPTVFAFATFGAMNDLAGLGFLAVGATTVWSAAAGLRNIVGHQLADRLNDESAGLTTWVRGVGADAARRIASRVLLPVELTCLGLIFAALWSIAPFAAAVFGVYAALHGVARLSGLWTEPLHAVPEPDRPRAVLYLFYTVWPPLILATALAVADRRWGWILLGHTLLFATTLLDEIGRVSALIGNRLLKPIANWYRYRALTEIGDLGNGILNWFRFRLSPWLRQTLPNWFRYRLTPWVTHAIPNWFRYRLWPFLTHTIPNWFGYRWPENRRLMGERIAHLTSAPSRLVRRLGRVKRR